MVGADESGERADLAEDHLLRALRLVLFDLVHRTLKLAVGEPTHDWPLVAQLLVGVQVADVALKSAVVGALDANIFEDSDEGGVHLLESWDIDVAEKGSAVWTEFWTMGPGLAQTVTAEDVPAVESSGIAGDPDAESADEVLWNILEAAGFGNPLLKATVTF